ncbi:MAG: hypothetical protein NZL91_05805 [Thermoflexales bacterium]|nr:hypothetical protein [Thermoflexales bacterium]
MRSAPDLASQLFRRLTNALQQGEGVCVIAAAGFGKTTLLRHLAQLWEGSLFRRVTYGSAEEVQELLAALKPLKRGTLVLIDDVHLLENAPPEAAQALLQALYQQRLRWAVGGRWLPRAWLPLLHHTQLVNEADLALSPPQIAAFLGVSEAEAEQCHAQTEGWPFAIAWLARGNDSKALSFDHAFFEQLRHRLQAELAHADLRRFLLRTAIPAWFDAELAAALLNEVSETPLGTSALLLEEALRRRLFLSRTPDGRGWRYLPLFRAFLRWLNSETERPWLEIAARHFERLQEWELALTHALEGKLDEVAISILARLPHDWLWLRGRVWTLWQWVRCLEPQIRQQAPQVLLKLGYELHRAGHWQEGRALVESILDRAQLDARHPLGAQALVALAGMAHIEGKYAESVRWAQLLASSPRPEDQLCAYKLLGDANSGLARFSEARCWYEKGISLAAQLGDLNYLCFLRHNLAVGVELPVGRLGRAQQLLRENTPFYQHKAPAPRVTHLVGWACLWVEGGEWHRAEQVLDEIAALAEQAESVQESNRFWYAWCRAMVAIGRGKWADAERWLTEAAQLIHEHVDRELAWTRAACWHARRRREPAQALKLAEPALAKGEHESPTERILLELEAALAAWEAGEASRLPTAARRAARFRIGTALVRCRAALALALHRAADPRWARHARIALASLEKPGYSHLLTSRDPELGVQFWSLCVRTALAPERAALALAALHEWSSIEHLLQSPIAVIRQTTAQALANAQDERAMPLLYRAWKHEKLPEVRTALERSLQELESATPPPLYIQLMGEFAVWRGEERIAEWPRPTVARLLQLLALHRQIPLATEAVMQALGIEDTIQGRRLFQRLLSWLKQALEPYMRPRGPLRYLALHGDTLQFDPPGVVSVDAETFRRSVTSLLAAPTLTAQQRAHLAEQLRRYRPLLQGQEDAWLTEHREHLEALYQRGRQRLSQTAQAVTD